MQPKLKLHSWLTQTRRLWDTAAKSVTWITGIIGPFLLPPPIGASHEEKTIWLQLTVFIVTVLVLLMFVAGQKLNKKHHIRWWGGLSAILLILAIISFVGYQYLSSVRTCKYNNEIVVIGTSYTEQAIHFMSSHKDHSCEYLLDSAAGKAGDIWTKESIDRTRIHLALTYLSCVPLFTLCIIGVIQAVYISETTGKKPRSRTNLGQKTNG